MKSGIRGKWRQSFEGVEERLDELPPELPYELQSKMFDQIAAVGIGGAGLTVTLIGTLLRNTSPVIWLPVIFFAAASMFAVSGNNLLIDGLFRRTPVYKRSKLYLALAVGLIGMAMGSLSMSVYYQGKTDVDKASK